MLNSIEQSVRQAGVIYLKNMIGGSWTAKDVEASPAAIASGQVKVVLASGLDRSVFVTNRYLGNFKKRRKKLGMLRFKPGATGWEASLLSTVLRGPKVAILCESCLEQTVGFFLLQLPPVPVNVPFTIHEQDKALIRDNIVTATVQVRSGS